MVAGLLRPDEGRIAVGEEVLFDSRAGIDVPPGRRRAGYVFQDGRLFPHKRVRSNLLYGLRLADPAHRWLDFDEAISFLGIGHLQIGRAHVCTPVTNAHLVCRLLLEKKNTINKQVTSTD